MKLYILMLTALFIAGCAGNEPDTAVSNKTPNRATHNSSSPNTEVSPVADKEKEARVLQKVQEFVSTNYAGWALKGTEDLGKSPLDLHIVKGAEEKVIKVNYKQFDDLNGQPYIVISKIAQNDLSEENLDDTQNKRSPNAMEKRNENSNSSNN